MKLRIIANSVPTSSPTQIEANADTYASRLAKLLPGEAFALYPVLLFVAKQLRSYGVLPTLDMCPPVCIAFDIVGAMAAWYALAVLAVFRARMTAGRRQGPQWTAVMISAVTFVLWVHLIGGNFGFDLVGAVLGATGSAVLLALFLVWVAVTPRAYKGDTVVVVA